VRLSRKCIDDWNDDSTFVQLPASFTSCFLYLRVDMHSAIRSVHFVGICGTAMASTAAAMRDKGVQVSGSDQNV